MSQGSHEFKGSVDFNQHELRNATFQRLLTPPISPTQGQIYYNTLLQSPFYWNQIKWNPFGLPPVHIMYANLAAMFAGQTNQLEGYFYLDLSSGVVYVYLGTTNGDISDYEPLITDGNRRQIIDENNTIFADRDSLQFLRMDITDDPSNNKTVISRPPAVYIDTAPPTLNILEGDIWINNITWKTYAFYDTFWVETGKNVTEFIGSGFIELDPIFQASAAASITQQDIDNWNSGSVTYNEVTSYRSIVESDGTLYRGYLLNTVPTITRVINGVNETANNVTDLETDWLNRVNLTYI